MHEKFAISDFAPLPTMHVVSLVVYVAAIAFLVAFVVLA